MTLNTPFISIIVPVYNGAKTLPDCLDALITLDYPKDRLEIIVVDNGSEDNSLTIARNYPVKLVEELQVKSSYAARNRGIADSRGEIIAFTDIDCVVSSSWLREAMKGFKAEKTGAVAGEILGYRQENFIEKCLIEMKHMSARASLIYPPLPKIQTANALYRREVFEAIGLFDPQLLSGGDADFSWRMQLETEYKIHYRPAAIVYHQHVNTLRSFCRQKAFHGSGEHNLRSKYADTVYKKKIGNDLQRPGVYLLYHAAGKFAIHAVKSLKGLARFKLHAFAAEWLNFLGDVSLLWGVWREKASLKQTEVVK